MCFHIPRIDDLLDQLNGKSALDARSACIFEIKMSQSSMGKTAYCTRNGLYEFKVLLFGLRNTPATFWMLMQSILAGLCNVKAFCSVYTDDIIVFSESTVKEHVMHLS